MDKIDKRYENGKIYTIKCKYNDKLIYVGSTISSLCDRMGRHCLDKKCSLYQYVNGDWDNWYIELYEEYPCNNRAILEKREGEITRQIGTINKSIAGRTKKEYFEDKRDEILEQYKKYRRENAYKIAEKYKEYFNNNKDKILEWHKEYYEENKEKIKNKQKQYREDNVDKFKEKNKKWYEDNKEKIAEYRKQKVECDICKSIVNRGDISTHKKTKKCLNYNVNNK
jgi:Uri superfamily endonuclease